MDRFEAGQTVTVSLTTPNPFGGPAITSHEKGVVQSCEGGVVLLDNGPGNDPGGPYNESSGQHIGPLFGCQMSISEYDPDLEYAEDDDD